MSEIYAITDLDGYANQIRIAAANSLTENCSDNLDDFISIGQLTNLIKSECLGFDAKDRPLLDENTNEKIFETTAIWIHNIALAKLAAKDLVECAWDDTNNEMVFWAKEKNNDKSKPRRKNSKTKRQDR